MRIFSELHPRTSVGQTGLIWSENGLTISSKRQRYVAQVEQRSPAGLMGGGAGCCRGQMEESKLITTQPLIPFQPIVSIFVQILGQHLNEEPHHLSSIPCVSSSNKPSFPLPSVGNGKYSGDLETLTRGLADVE